MPYLDANRLNYAAQEIWWSGILLYWGFGEGRLANGQRYACFHHGRGRRCIRYRFDQLRRWRWRFLSRHILDINLENFNTFPSKHVAQFGFERDTHTKIITKTKNKIKPSRHFAVSMSLNSSPASFEHSHMIRGIWQSIPLVTSTGHTLFSVIYHFRSPTMERPEYFINLFNAIRHGPRILTTIGRQFDIFSNKFVFFASSEKMCTFLVPWLAVHKRHNS